MKLQNNTKHSFVHSYFDEQFKLVILQLRPKEIKEIPDEVAKSWLKSKGVVEYVAPQDVKSLEDENAKLKEELEKLKKQEEPKVEEPKKEKSKAKSTRSRAKKSTK